ncbi:MAG: molecular chaperone HtpG [Candidatus Hodarchaeales archaeon]
MSSKNADVDSEVKTYEFQAETQRVLDILINKLYKNREIFLRELVSNAADALHKLRIILYDKSEEVFNPEDDLGIRVKFDEDELTITVSDNGIGMTYDEAVQNLGTIAQSGTLEFLKQLENSTEMANLIGQFGVGFYSAFIVSKEVVVRSRSYHIDSKAIEWRSDGSGKFSVSYTDKENRGTDVILYLKEDAKEFADKYKLENIIKKYSDFVGFPIRIGDEAEIINRQIPIWHQSEEEVSDEEYDEFYRQVSMDWNKPFHRILINVDAPIQFRALLFLPQQRNRLMMTPLYQDYGLRLYSKKILVQEKAKDLLPEYLRFVFGVVDSEDLPLNVSREVIQVDQSIRRISKVIVGKIISELEKLSEETDEEEAEEEKDKPDYLSWWKQFGVFIKEGITQDEKRREKLLRLLRIRTSKSGDEFITLPKYVENMAEGQEEIYYLLGENIETLRRSPHLEYYKKHDLEVILFDEPIDSFVMMHVTTFKGKKFKAIDQAEPEPSEDKKEEKKEEKDEEKDKPKDEFLTKLKDILGEKVIDVRYTDKLTDSPCRLVNPSGLGAFTRVLKYMNENYVPQKKIMELNPEHGLIKKMKKIYQKNAEDTLLDLGTLLLLESQELREGILIEPSEMISHVMKLMEKALE